MSEANVLREPLVAGQRVRVAEGDGIGWRPAVVLGLHVNGRWVMLLGLDRVQRLRDEIRTEAEHESERSNGG